MFGMAEMVKKAFEISTRLFTDFVHPTLAAVGAGEHGRKAKRGRC
jgi:hypothetical protein